MQSTDTTVRPKDLSTVLVKHMMTDARDCRIEWKADFAKMEILLYVPFISPALLLDFLGKLPRIDERFQKTGITDAVQISSRFNVKLCVAHGDNDVWYRLSVYKLYTPNEKLNRLEIELTAIPG